MSAVTNPATSAGSTKTSSVPTKDPLADVDVNQFLKLMITELQNQDPLNPLDNAQMIAQIGELRSISSTDKLTSTLDSVLLGQNISSATGLIGSTIEGVSDDSQRIRGIVDRVGVEKGVPKLHLDLETKASMNTAKGKMEKGDYEYRVVWRNDEGKLVGVNPSPDGSDVQKGSISITGEAEKGQAVLISNLPISDSDKEVYRRKKGSKDFQLVGTITDPKQSSFIDTKSDNEASTALVGVPSLFPKSSAHRTFEVSLNNVGEIQDKDASP